MMKRVNFTISEVEIKRLKVLSKKTGLSASEILRRAIDEYWERFEKKGKRESVKKIILIFLALMLTMLMPLMVKRVNAADAWVLWKQRTEVQSDGEIKTRWFVQTSLTEYTVCYDMALRLAEQDRKTLNAGGKLTVVRIGDKEGEGVIIYYRCFPDTFDPGK